MSNLDPSSESETGEEDSGDEPSIPEGVLRGIEDIAAGETASKDEIEDALDF